MHLFETPPKSEALSILRHRGYTRKQHVRALQTDDVRACVSATPNALRTKKKSPSLSPLPPLTRMRTRTDATTCKRVSSSKLLRCCSPHPVSEERTLSPLRNQVLKTRNDHEMEQRQVASWKIELDTVELCTPIYPHYFPVIVRVAFPIHFDRAAQRLVTKVQCCLATHSTF